MRIHQAAVLAIAGGALLCACTGASGSSDTTANKPTTTTVPTGTATITAFTVPDSVACGSGPSTTVSITYAVSGAKSQAIFLDGRQTSLPSASGSVSVPVHCDAVPHTVVLRALDEQSHPTTQEKILKTALPG
jgi:hypothetical protein